MSDNNTFPYKITLDPEIHARVVKLAKKLNELSREADRINEEGRRTHALLWETVDEDPQCDSNEFSYSLHRETYELTCQGRLDDEDDNPLAGLMRMLTDPGQGGSDDDPTIH